jgi:hypothetical protein
VARWRRCSDNTCEVWWADAEPECWVCGSDGEPADGPTLTSQVGAPLFAMRPLRPDAA